MSNQFDILVGDCRETLRTLEAESVQTCVTSPPYHGLRRYGDGSKRDAEIGQESSVEQHIAALVEVFREVRRVLHPTGTVWVNYGDAYAGSGRGGNPPESPHQKQATNKGCVVGQTARDAANTRGPGDERTPAGLKPKDLIGLPWRLAFALQAAGWYLRCDIIWEKPSCMPSSQRDRPTRSHEYIFLLSKQARYFYDDVAVREPAAQAGRRRNDRIGGDKYDGESTMHSDGGMFEGSDTRALRSVWRIPAEPTRFNHYAAFPRELARQCIRAGTSERGKCSKCGTPWGRVVDVSYELLQDTNNTTKHHDVHGWDAAKWPRMRKHNATTGWSPSCDCGAEVVPCVVLDPFAGTGRSGAAALELGRRFVGCELYQEYADYARTYIPNPDPEPVEPDAPGQVVMEFGE